MIGSMEQGSTSQSISACTGSGTSTFQPKHKVFLSHSGAQKGFVEQLFVDLERCDRAPFLDKRRECLPIGEDFPKHIFKAIEECEVGVVVLSEEFFTSKWPMLEFVAMTNVKKRKPSFTIILVLLGLSLSECRDVDNHMRWLSLWQTWAEGETRIDLQDWVNTLELFGPTNALKYNFELGEVKYREEIVEAICKLVPSGTQFEDSHIQGRSRLCKVIHERIKQSKDSRMDRVHVIGLYGFGGIGKTTLCKSMCNYLREEYRGKVAHIELGSGSEEELLKDVLQGLTDMNLERLGAMNVDKYCNPLMRDMMNVKVFLTIDNVSSATRKQALTLLRAKYGLGSVLLVTARSLIELTSLGIPANECMEMPELEMEEARSLFLHHAIYAPRTNLSDKDDYELVSACIQRCYFKKGDGKSSHYHPLALQALGEQLGSYEYAPEQWRSLLHEIDFLNLSRKPQHPVFSILRTSFDALVREDQLLFMDVALFGPYAKSGHPYNCPPVWSIFDWLCIVHAIPMTTLKRRLEILMRKSLLENVDDELKRIGMHDLWREFARLETKAVEFEKRQWMFEWDECNALEAASGTSGGPLINMGRMFFLDKGFKKLEDVNFFCFPNVTILKLHALFPISQQLDLTGLKHLKILELLDITDFQTKQKPLISLSGLGSLLKLVLLRWSSIPPNSPCIDEINHLTNLQILDLSGASQVLDVSNLFLLRVACFCSMVSVATIIGFSANHTKLQVLDLSYSRDLQSCPSVGELVELQELYLNSCSKLKEMPNIQNLRQLQKLDISCCFLLQGLPGLGDLVNLVKLRAFACESLAELPNMCNLKNLRKLDLCGCRCIKSLPGVNELVCLQFLSIMGCGNPIQLPDVHNLTNLQVLEFGQEQPLQSFVELNNLLFLRRLHVGVDEVHDGFDLHKLTMLTQLDIDGWQGQGFSSLAELVSLESATIRNCKGVHLLPDLQKLSRLDKLDFQNCEFEDISSLSHLTSLKTLMISNCNKLKALPNLRELINLEILGISYCTQLIDVHGILGLRWLQWLQSSGNLHLHENLRPDRPPSTILCILLGYRRRCAYQQQELAVYSQLRELTCEGCPIQELPDLAHFPKLSSLNVQECVNLKNLTCVGPLSPTLEMLDVSGCVSLKALPDLTNSLEMVSLDVSKSGIVLGAQLIQDMNARWPHMSLHLQNEDDDEFGLISEDNDENDDDIDLITEDGDENDDDDMDLAIEA